MHMYIYTYIYIYIYWSDGGRRADGGQAADGQRMDGGWPADGQRTDGGSHVWICKVGCAWWTFEHQINKKLLYINVYT